MPEYSLSNMNLIIERDMCCRLIDACDHIRDKALISMLWITGARPSEIADLDIADCKLGDAIVTIHMPTKKKGKKHFSVEKRPLEFERPLVQKDPIIEILVHYLSKVDAGPVFPRCCTRMMAYIVGRAGMMALRTHICPYNFRHSRCTLLMRDGMSVADLNYWRGSDSIASTMRYVHAQKKRVRI